MTRKRRFTFRLRSLLIVVALAAVGLKTWQVWRERTAHFAELARQHEQQAQRSADIGWGRQRFGGFTEEANREAKPYWEAHTRHNRLAQQYRRASWLGFVLGASE